METKGTVTCTKHSATVTGSGTDFDSTMEGKYFKIIGNEEWYLIYEVVSATEITLDRNYRGETASGQYYELGDSQQWEEPDIISEPETDAGKFGDVP